MVMEIETFCCETISVGMTASLTRIVRSQDIQSFAELSGDYNPIHLDEEYAAATRFGRRIAHGMLSASFISTVIGTRLPGIGSVYVSQSINFIAPVFLDDVVETIVEIMAFDPKTARATLCCQCVVGETVVIEGEALILVPRRR